MDRCQLGLVAEGPKIYPRRDSFAELSEQSLAGRRFQRELLSRRRRVDTELRPDLTVVVRMGPDNVAPCEIHIALQLPLTVLLVQRATPCNSA